MELDIDIDIGMESRLPKLEFDQEFDQELMDCVEVSRRVSRRMLATRIATRIASSVASSSSVSSRVASRVVSSMASSVSSSVSKRRGRTLCQSSGKPVECKDARADYTSVARNKANTSADCASSTTLLRRTTLLICGKTANSCNGCRQGKTKVELWQLEKCDLRIEAWEAGEIQLEVRVGAKRVFMPKLGARLKHDRIDDDAEDERNEKACAIAYFHSTTQILEHLR